MWPCGRSDGRKAGRHSRGQASIHLEAKLASSVGLLERHPEDFQPGLPVPHGVHDDGLAALVCRPWTSMQGGKEIADDGCKLLRSLNGVVLHDPCSQPAEELVDVLVSVALAQERSLR